MKKSESEGERLTLASAVAQRQELRAEADALEAMLRTPGWEYYRGCLARVAHEYQAALLNAAPEALANADGPVRFAACLACYQMLTAAPQPETGVPGGIVYLVEARLAEIREALGDVAPADEEVSGDE